MHTIVEKMKVNRKFGLLALLLLLSLILAACGGGGNETAAPSGGTTPAPAQTSSGSTPTTPPASTADKTAEGSGVVVRMSNYSYDPKEIRVKVGETITFVNEDHLAHDVVQTTPSEVLAGNYGFESPQVMPGSQWTTSFDKAGSYPILCTVEAHYLLGMTGEIIVEE